MARRAFAVPARRPAPLIVTFCYPSTPQYTGGVVVLYEYANGLARRGHEVHLVHAPSLPGRIESVDQLDWFEFAPSITHHLADTVDDPGLPAGDVVFPTHAAAHMGLPASLIQGYGMLDVKIERPVFRHPSPKLCVASWLRDVGIAWGAPAEQMLYVPMGLDHDTFRVVRPLDDRPVDVALLHNEHPVKGWDDAMSALTALRQRRPGLRVEAFGIVPPTHEIPDWITYRLSPDRPTLVEDILNRAKVFVQPSWKEGFGFTAVEAMACGCALATTDNGGSRDYAIPDETAAVVRRRDPPALAAAVEGLLADDERRHRVAVAGEVHVRRFQWSRGAEIMEDHLCAYVADPDRFRAPPRPAPMFLEGLP